jgi:translation initiation factor 3 subunit F
MASSLFLSDASSVHVNVLPVVYFSIVYHYSRRSEKQERVIGTLLGKVVGNQVEVSNCFPVPHSETEDQVMVDMKYHETMYNLHQRVNPKEVIVGWYATGSDITEYSVLIHDFYNRECDQPVHLLLDTSLKTNRLDMKAVVSTPIGSPSGTAGSLFTPVKCTTLFHEPERVGVEALARTLSAPDHTESLLSELEQVSSATQGLTDMLSKASDYVDRVLGGEVKGDPEVGRFLLDTLSVSPEMDSKQFEDMFNGTLQDLLMVTYLANLTRTQVALQEKLNGVLTINYQ